MRKYLLLILGIVVMLPGCATPESERWVNVTVCKDDKWEGLPSGDRKPNALVYSYQVAESPQVKQALTIAGLSEQGQAAFIAAVAQKAKDSLELREELGRPIVASKSDPKHYQEIAPLKRHRTMVISVSKGLDAHLGDRLAWARVEVSPLTLPDKSDSFKFTGYTVAATNDVAINIANIKRTQEINVGASFTPTLAGTIQGGASFNPSRKDSKETTANVTQTISMLDVAIQPKLLRVTREGEHNIDVNGTTVVDLSLTIPGPIDSVLSGYVLAVREQVLDNKDGLLPARLASAILELVTLPPPCDVKAKVTLIYKLRRILGDKAKTYVEGDDNVLIEQGVKETEQVVLIPKEEVLLPLWRLTVSSADKKKDGLDICATAPLLPDPLTLIFTDYLDAYVFARWLSAHSGMQPQSISIAGNNMKNITLTAGGDKPLSPGDRITAMRYTPSCPGEKQTVANKRKETTGKGQKGSDNQSLEEPTLKP